MGRRNSRALGRRGLFGLGLFALALLGALLAATAPAAGQLPPILPPILDPPSPPGGGAAGPGSTPGARVGSTGRRPEQVRRIDVLPRSNRGATILSLGPAKLPRIRRGRRYQALAEFQVSTTCHDPSRRCIGRRYRFSPKITAKVVLTGRARSTGGRRSIRLSPTRRVRCAQRRPDRNHHCTLALVGDARRFGRLPRCAPSCHANLVVSARSPKARPGNVVVVGGDRPNGTVEGRKARLSVISTAARTRSSKRTTRTRMIRSIPVDESAKRGSRVVTSMALPRLRKGETLRAVASHLASTSGLPYSAYIGSRIVVGRTPRATMPRSTGRLISYGGSFGQRNGFNCTRGPSGYRSPCTVRKAGVVKVRKTPPRRTELYVNLVSRAKPLLEKAKGSDRVGIRETKLAVRRYGR